MVYQTMITNGECKDKFHSSSFDMLQNKFTRLIIVAGLVVLADQITKALVIKYVPLHKNISIITGIFDITHILNPGGAFGLMADMSAVVRTVVFLFLSSLAVGLILYFYIKTPRDFFFLSSAFALIFGGAIGNLIDRVRFGVVVDYLDFYIGKYHWPAFNIADSAITVGLFIFIYHLVFKKMPQE
jgi:signal peptidase II